MLEIFLPGGLLESGPGEACDKDSGRHRNDLVEEQTWKKRKSNSSAHIIIQEQCYVLLCFNKKSDIFSAKYKNFAPNWVQWNVFLKVLCFMFLFSYTPSMNVSDLSCCWEWSLACRCRRSCCSIAPLLLLLLLLLLDTLPLASACLNIVFSLPTGSDIFFLSLRLFGT